MARQPVSPDSEKTQRSRGTVGPALSTAVLTLAAFASPASADQPAPGNGTAIWRDAGGDPSGTGAPVTLPGGPAPSAPAYVPATAPPIPAKAPAPAQKPAGRPSTPATPTRRPARREKPHARRHHKDVQPDEAGKHHAKKHKRRKTDDATADAKVDGLSLAPKTAPVPDLVLEKFDIPPFLLPVYQAAAVTYQVPWTVLAAINSVETDYGRNVAVSSAGALGWMQFMPSTWKAYGVDANLDGKRDPNNPADAIFAAARYLHAAGADKDLRAAIYAYNHADWYVDMVLERADELAKLPSDLVDSLVGLAQARLPIPGRAHVEKKLGPRKWVKIDAPSNRRVVAVADGRVVSMGTDRRLGRFVVLEDAYGNRFTYAHLGSIAARYAVPKHRTLTKAQIARELHLPHHDKRPAQAATRKVKVKSTVAGPMPSPTVAGAMLTARRGRPAPESEPATATPMPSPTFAGAMLTARSARNAVTPSARAIAAHAIGLKPREVDLRTLRPGAHVIAGTIIGHVAFRSPGHSAPLHFAVRPAGHSTPRVDARPLLKGWRLLKSTAVYGPAGTSTLDGKKRKVGIGQALLMGKEALGRRVLADERITMYECGREDIAAGQVDRRILVVLEFLADAGLNPTVSALKCGHSLMTASGNISEHSTGDAVDIAAINGIPIIGHQGPGSITDIAVRKLLSLQGTMKPHQIITLMNYVGTDNTFAMGDHDDHIHVGFHPEGGTGGTNSVTSSLAPDQWSKLMTRLRHIDNPTVSTHVSRYALRAKPSSD